MLKRGRWHGWTAPSRLLLLPMVRARLIGHVAPEACLRCGGRAALHNLQCSFARVSIHLNACIYPLLGWGLRALPDFHPDRHLPALPSYHSTARTQGALGVQSGSAPRRAVHRWPGTRTRWWAPMCQRTRLRSAHGQSARVVQLRLGLSCPSICQVNPPCSHGSQL